MAEINLADEIVARATAVPSADDIRKGSSGIMSRKVLDAGSEDYDIESYIGDYLNTIREERTPMTFDAYQAEDIDARVDAMDAQAQRGALSELTGATYYAPTKDVTSLATLMSLISGGESYGGSLDAANRGTINDKIIGSTKVAERDGKKLSEMTLSEIK